MNVEPQRVTNCRTDWSQTRGKSDSELSHRFTKRFKTWLVKPQSRAGRRACFAHQQLQRYAMHCTIMHDVQGKINQKWAGQPGGWLASQLSKLVMVRSFTGQEIRFVQFDLNFRR